MKHSILVAAIALLCTVTFSKADAQPYYGFQSIGIHTFHISVAWNGEPWFGVGYTYRDAGRTFTDWQAEWRFPIQSLYDLDNHEVMAGLKKPLRVRRSFTAIGFHGKLLKSTSTSSSSKQYSVALTVLPSYVYTASLSNGPYGTIGARATYNPIILVKEKDHQSGEVTSTKFAGHNVQVGAHFDVLLKRSTGITTNAVYSKVFKADPSVIDSKLSSRWNRSWDANIGTTYWLRRW